MEKGRKSLKVTVLVQEREIENVGKCWTIIVLGKRREKEKEKECLKVIGLIWNKRKERLRKEVNI